MRLQRKENIKDRHIYEMIDVATLRSPMATLPSLRSGHITNAYLATLTLCPNSPYRANFRYARDVRRNSHVYLTSTQLGIK